MAALAEAGPNLEGAAPSAGLPNPGEAAGSPSTAALSAAPLDNQFDEQGAPSTRAQAAASEPFSLGTPWPEPWPVEWCRGAAAALLRSQPVPTGPSGGEAVARKVLLKVTPSERAMAERPGETNHSAVADAWMARIALAGAEVDGEKLAAAGSTVLVDGDAVAALAKLVDGAGERLQQEANKFIAKGDTESLRVLTGARSALTQELLAFKKLADRLRGLGAAPALGPGGLDPDVQLAGRTAARTRPPAIGVAAVKRAEFSGFDQKPKKKHKPLIVGLLAVLFVAGLANVLYFSRVRSKEARPGEMDQAGHGIVRIAISGKRALVQVTPLWAEHPADNWRPLAAALGK